MSPRMNARGVPQSHGLDVVWRSVDPAHKTLVITKTVMRRQSSAPRVVEAASENSQEDCKARDKVDSVVELPPTKLFRHDACRFHGCRFVKAGRRARSKILVHGALISSVRTPSSISGGTLAVCDLPIQQRASQSKPCDLGRRNQACS